MPIRSLQVLAFHKLEDLEALRPAWEELLAKFPGATTFSTWEWLAPWWRAFGNGQQLLVLAFYDSSSKLVALAPLALTVRRAAGIQWKVLRLMGDGSGDSDNLDLPVAAGFEQDFVHALVGYLEAHSDLWDFCEFNIMPRDSVGGNYLLPCLREIGWAHVRSEHPRRFIDLSETWKDYLQQLSYNERRNIQRYRRRLESRYRVRLLKCEQPGELRCYLDSLFALHQTRWQSRGQPGSFDSPARRQFYFEISEELLARQQLEFWLLELDGEIVAAEFDFRYGSTVFALQQGFALSRPEDRTGTVLRAYVLEQLISAGIRRFDFLGGDNPYKDRWYPRKDTYLNIRFARPFSSGSLFLHAAETAQTAKQSLRAHLPPRAWAFLHGLNMRLRGGDLESPQEEEMR